MPQQVSPNPRSSTNTPTNQSRCQSTGTTQASREVNNLQPIRSSSHSLVSMDNNQARSQRRRSSSSVSQPPSNSATVATTHHIPAVRSRSQSPSGRANTQSRPQRRRSNSHTRPPVQSIEIPAPPHSSPRPTRSRSQSPSSSTTSHGRSHLTRSHSSRSSIAEQPNASNNLSYPPVPAPGYNEILELRATERQRRRERRRERDGVTRRLFQLRNVAIDRQLAWNDGLNPDDLSHSSILNRSNSDSSSDNNSRRSWSSSSRSTNSSNSRTTSSSSRFDRYLQARLLDDIIGYETTTRQLHAMSLEDPSVRERHLESVRRNSWSRD